MRDQILDKSGKIRYWKDEPVYTTLSSELGMQPKAIYQTILRKQHIIFRKSISKDKVVFQEDITDDETSENEPDFEHFVVSLTKEEQTHFELTRNVSDQVVLAVGWTNQLSLILQNSMRSACVFNFSWHYVRDGDFVTKAYCSQCGSALKIESTNKITSILVWITDFGSREHKFTKRRRLIGDRLTYYKEKLKSNVPYVVLNNELAENIDSNKQMPIQQYPTTRALKKLRSVVRNENNLHASAINSVRIMKYSPFHKNTIKEIGTDPLFVIFWNDYQTYYFNQVSKKQRVCISIDATGSLISNQSLLSDLNLDSKIELQHVFLYLIMLKNENNSSKPIAQCLSADQHARKIRYFLERFTDEFKIPNEVTIDDSAALIKSVILAFTSCVSTQNYIATCHKILNGDLSRSLECYIRLDVNHFVKNVKKAKVFTKMLDKQKMFYQSLIGVMIQCDSFAQITEIVKKILLVASIPYEAENFPTYESLRSLKRLIKTHNMSSFVEQIDHISSNDKLEDSELLNDLDGCEQIEWFTRIEKEVEKIHENMPNQSSSDIRENYYYCIEFIPYLKKLCTRIVLWTPIMNEYFNSSKITTSSSDVESQNHIIKNIIFRDTKLPIRLDTFMEKYLKAIKGDIFMACAEQNYQRLGQDDNIDETSNTKSAKNMPQSVIIVSIHLQINYLFKTLQPNYKKIILLVK